MTEHSRVSPGARGGMIVNVCPSAIAEAPASRVWQVLTTTERIGDWTDSQVIEVRPPGPAHAGQRIDLAASALGRRWRVSIEVQAMNAEAGWIQLRIGLPFGIVNDERVTLTQLDPGHTLVRFN